MDLKSRTDSYRSKCLKAEKVFDKDKKTPIQTKTCVPDITGRIGEDPTNLLPADKDDLT